MGAAGQGKMTTHSQKKLDDAALIEFRNRFNLPLSDEQATQPRLLQAGRRQRRDALPARAARGARRLPAARGSRRCDGGAGAGARALCGTSPSRAAGKEMSHHHGLRAHARQPAEGQGSSGPRIVPIVADEARTFGMANLFKQVGIYSSVGQRYEPEDIGSVLSLPRGDWTARSWKRASARPAPSPAGRPRPPATACTACAMLPFYIYYSMFGFQRVGDAIWAAADQRARGFLLGATSGRTTLGGEGLQHQDGTQPPGGRDHPQLQGLRPGVRRRDGGDRRPRHARDAGGAAGRLLLRHADERELRPARACRRAWRTT